MYPVSSNMSSLTQLTSLDTLQPDKVTLRSSKGTKSTDQAKITLKRQQSGVCGRCGRAATPEPRRGTRLHPLLCTTCILDQQSPKAQQCDKPLAQPSLPQSPFAVAAKEPFGKEDEKEDAHMPLGAKVPKKPRQNARPSLKQRMRLLPSPCKPSRRQPTAKRGRGRPRLAIAAGRRRAQSVSLPQGPARHQSLHGAGTGYGTSYGMSYGKPSREGYFDSMEHQTGLITKAVGLTLYSRFDSAVPSNAQFRQGSLNQSLPAASAEGIDRGTHAVQGGGRSKMRAHSMQQYNSQTSDSLEFSGAESEPRSESRSESRSEARSSASDTSQDISQDEASSPVRRPVPSPIDVDLVCSEAAMDTRTREGSVVRAVGSYDGVFNRRSPCKSPMKSPDFQTLQELLMHVDQLEDQMNPLEEQINPMEYHINPMEYQFNPMGEQINPMEDQINPMNMMSSWRVLVPERQLASPSGDTTEFPVAGQQVLVPANNLPDLDASYAIAAGMAAPMARVYSQLPLSWGSGLPADALPTQAYMQN